MKRVFYYPLAVYVATFANGETARLSVGAHKGKIDFARAREMIAHMWRDWDRVELQEGSRAELPKVYHGGAYRLQHGPIPGARTQASVDASTKRYHSMPARTDIVAGHVEHNGRVIPDPFFAPAAADNVVTLPRRRAKADPIDGVLTALDKLSLSDLEAIASLVDEMIDARLAA